MFDVNKKLLNYLLNNQVTVATECTDPDELKDVLDHVIDVIDSHYVDAGGIMGCLLECSLEEVDTGDVAQNYFEYLDHNCP
jgi:hypothetical protein